VPDAIYFKDAQGKFIQANGAMAARLGLDDPKQAMGKTALEMPDQAAALRLEEGDEGVLTTGQAQHYRVDKRVEENGSESWDLTTRLPLEDSTGKVVGVIVISRSITEQKLAEEKAQEAVRRRDQFLAMLSHELRNPLGAIVTATTLLRRAETGASKSVTRALDVMTRQSQQMARLLDDLLEVNRVTRNRIELRKQYLDLGSVIREAAEAVREPLEEAGLALVMAALPADVPVQADPARLQQILTNLLGNAVKYTPGRRDLARGGEGGGARGDSYPGHRDGHPEGVARLGLRSIRPGEPNFGPLGRRDRRRAHARSLSRNAARGDRIRSQRRHRKGLRVRRPTAARDGSTRGGPGEGRVDAPRRKACAPGSEDRRRRRQ